MQNPRDSEHMCYEALGESSAFEARVRNASPLRICSSYVFQFSHEPSCFGTDDYTAEAAYRTPAGNRNDSRGFDIGAGAVEHPTE